MLDLKTFYHNGGTEDIDEPKLVNEVQAFNPHLVVISICYSQVSKVKVILERPGVFAMIRLRRNLVASTNGKVIDLDEKQVNLIYEVANPNNTSKNVVIQGPEGSGKTLLGIEIVKVLVSNYVYTNNLTPQQVKSHIRVIFSACYKSYNDPEEVALWKKQIESIVNRDHVNSLYEVDVVSVQARVRQNPNEYNGDPNIILDVIKKNNRYGSFQKTFIMIDELDPSFESSDWAIYEPFSCNGVNDVQIVFSLKYHFHDMKIRNVRNVNDARDYNEIDRPLALPNVLIGRLHKAYRCSNEIRNFVYYLLMHEPDNVNVHKFKRFQHYEPSFGGQKPIWLDTPDAASFINKVRYDSRFSQLLCESRARAKEEETVVLIYDQDTIDEQEKGKLIGLCQNEKWNYCSKTEAVGTEFSAVIIYGFNEFHFDAFTRAISQLIIVTTSSSL